MKYLKLFENFEKTIGKLERVGDSSYDTYELMLIPLGRKLS
jgi:hypothetical protein